MADNMPIDKKEAEGSDDSRDSTAEAETRAPQQRRKGGRKPLYATSEKRKQRNRQAQAAFRVRRTEYLQQLEETIRVHETNLHNLQTAYRSATDECLMLRYKNSLLERMLLEKGIDVQAELQRNAGPQVDKAHVPASQTPTSSAALKIEPESPQSRPASTSPASPAIPSPASEFPGSPILDISGRMGKEEGTGDTKGLPVAALESSLQSHFDQLEQEYNAHADMVDDQDLSELSGPGPNPGPLSTTSNLHQQTPNLQQQSTLQSQDWQMGGNSLCHSSMNLPLELYNLMLGMDPFGLSASTTFL
ncbi:hypothetical protein DL98DRAFT_598216 [Cadophora sp. DSE1049]|nr:hypothetical protein DL98DRAFT_598216 [Cadophora sp. DSE1049]